MNTFSIMEYWNKNDKKNDAKASILFTTFTFYNNA